MNFKQINTFELLRDGKSTSKDFTVSLEFLSKKLVLGRVSSRLIAHLIITPD